MGLESLFLFTLLGGLAAGAYVLEACFQRTRTGERPWLVPLVVVVLFAIGMIAAATHVHSLSRAFASIGAGTVNFGSSMVKEVLFAVIFFVLVLIDMIITFVKKGELPVVFNGTTLQKIIFNGVEIESLIVNGAKLFCERMKRRVCGWLSGLRGQGSSVRAGTAEA